jgi:hypothetical protein
MGPLLRRKVIAPSETRIRTLFQAFASLFTTLACGKT